MSGSRSQPLDRTVSTTPAMPDLCRWDVLTGAMHGELAEASALPTPTLRDPRQCLDVVVARALRRPPCVISFSGGRDSSAMLAVAANVARREGLPLPVPATLRFPSAHEANESEWQELVIRHLGITDWLRLDVGDEHGFVGPVARRVLARYGLLWPANTHLHVPLLEHAQGGTLMTGIDGDGLFGMWAWVRPPGHRRAPMRGYVGRRAVGALPPSLRRRALERQVYLPHWLHQDAHRAYAEFRAASWATEPWRWDDRMRWYWRRRYVWGLQRSMALLAAEVDAEVIHPLLDGDFIAALGFTGGRDGLGDRTAIMRRVFGDLVPDALLTRDTKAFFDDVFWTPETRGFAARVGDVAYPDLVDLDRAKAEWQRQVPNFGSALLLQATWLRTRGCPVPA